MVNSLIQDKSNKNLSSNYFLRSLSIHANQLLLSSALTFPTPRSSSEREFSPNPYAPIYNQNFKNLQEFQIYIDNLNKDINIQEYEEIIWFSPYINPIILEDEDISDEQI
jgi:hypothetical protein